MINPVQALAEYEGDDFSEYLEKLQLLHIFEDLIKSYIHNKPVLRQIIRYILFTYSLDSEMVSSQGEWSEVKKRIFEYVMLPHTFYGDTVLLESESVVTTISKWLEYQDKDIYTELCRLKDLRSEMQRSLSLSIETCGYNQKMQNAEFSQKLNKMIKDLQSELIQNSEKLKVGATEVKQNRKRNVMGVEKFSVK